MRTSLIMLLVCVACDDVPDARGSAEDVAALLHSETAGGASTSTNGCRPRPPRAGRVCDCEPGAYLKPDRRGCWQWHAVQRIESYDGGDATQPRVATNPQGKAVAVWQQASGTVTSLWSSRWTNSGWTGAVEIDGMDPNDPNAVQLTEDDRGNSVALWTGARGTIHYAANLMRNSAWGTLQVLFESAPSSAFYGPVLSGSRNGAALVVWGSTAGRGSTLAASTLSGTTWTTVSLPLAPAAQLPPLGNIRAASGPNGEGTILWSQADTKPARLWLNQFRNAQWGTPLEVDISAAISFKEAALAIMRGPAELVAWSAPQGIWANRHTSAWTGAVMIRNVAANTTVSKLQLVSDSRGTNAFAIWLENDGARSSVWASRFSANTWSPAVNIEAVTTGNADSPSLALEPSGIAVAAWSHAATHVDIWANRYAPESGWGTALRIENDDAGDAASPSVAVDAHGDAQAVWQQSDGTRVNVVSSRFD
jgi:hypothetical protein